MTHVSKGIENRNEAEGASLGKAVPPPAEWRPSSCLSGVPLLLILPGTVLGSTPCNECASSPLGLVVTAAPGPQPGWEEAFRDLRGAAQELLLAPRADRGQGTGTQQHAWHWNMAPRWGGEMMGLQGSSAGAKAR